MSEGSVGAQPATPAILHRILIIMVIALGVVFGALAAIGLAPLIRDESRGANLIAWAFAAIQAVMILFAVAFLAPRVPRRRPGQSVEVYWADSEAGPRLLMIWFLCEGASTLGLVAFLLFGHPAPAIATAVAFAALVLLAPGRFMEVVR